RRLRREPRRPLADPVRPFASSSRFKLRAVVVGSTGYGRAADRRRLEAELRRAAAKARVLTDLELAWAGAFEKEGVLVLAGTGSVAFGKDARGRRARVGGLGPYLGDEGSAFWIGREWLRGRSEDEALAYAHRPHPQAAVAA